MATQDMCSSSSTITTKKKQQQLQEDGFSNTHEERSRCCFEEWMQLQREDLTHLLKSLHQPTNNDTTTTTTTVIRNCISHFEHYISNRTLLAQEHPSPLFAPTWCTSLENSLLWMAGCRPSIFIRLIYALTSCSSEPLITNDDDNKNGNNTVTSIGELSPSQMTRVNGLHMRTIKAEEKLTSELASWQEELADEPIALIAAKGDCGDEVVLNNMMNEEAEMALKEHEKVMGKVIGKADELRLNTMKELVLEILKPTQALQFLVASKKLHLSLHQWGKRRDEKQRRIRCYHSISH
ncbi:protein DOG1-like 1 [Cucumis sativus]|uniref:DOG1 domain-containing protein n=1 Tax=Cucumis sativus TaxID=3659 RepID=A0A0A0LXS6_CUCSA|nr:protein DOG1-like 1 [Cucumis sativus]